MSEEIHRDFIISKIFDVIHNEICIGNSINLAEMYNIEINIPINHTDLEYQIRNHIISTNIYRINLGDQKGISS